jgi:hypothetical protein
MGVPGSREHAFQRFDVGSAVVHHHDPCIRTWGRVDRLGHSPGAVMPRCPDGGPPLARFG